MIGEMPMFCAKCGSKNTKSAKFCEKCGQKLVESDNEKRETKSNKSKSKINELSKKNKIIMGVVLLVVIIAIIILCILLNNPVKKVEDNLESYYSNYKENNNKELIEIGKVLKSNKENIKILNDIKETTHKSMKKWVKNFNTEYQDKEELRESYNKVYGALKDIYSYFNGLEYMIDSKLYNEYEEELQKLNNSKNNYFSGKEYEDNKNEYYAYYYYQKVDEEDCYYKKSSQYVNNYVKGEIEKLKEEASKIIPNEENISDEEQLKNYIELLKYLKNNKISNNIDVSNSEEYKKLYSEASNKVIEYTKKIAAKKEQAEDLDGAIITIETTMKYYNNDSVEYKELEELIKDYKDKAPKKLSIENRTSYNGVSISTWKKTINNEEYSHYIGFNLKEDKKDITYKLNKEYTKLRAKIVWDKEWLKDFKGYFIIKGDDKEIYRSNDLTSDSEIPIEIDINIKEIDNLKIEFISDNKVSGLNNYIYLVEPYLYK